MHPFLKHFEAMETLNQVSRELKPDNAGGDLLGCLLSALEPKIGAEPEKAEKDAALKKLLGGLFI